METIEELFYDGKITKEELSKMRKLIMTEEEEVYKPIVDKFINNINNKSKPTKHTKNRPSSPTSITHDFEEDKKTSKTYKEGNIMKGRSDLKKKTNGKYEVETELNIKKGLEPKVQRALKKSVNEELTKGFKGGSINLDYSDSSSDEEKEVKKKVDINELRNYAKMLSHLLDHIEDPKEPIDKKDYKDVKKLIDNMEKVKKGRGRPKKH